MDKVTARTWVAIAQEARMAHRVLHGVGDARRGSNFAQIDSVYPYEKASDWHRAYLTAALEHLIVWADIVAPFKFHPEHEVTHTFRPAYTLARAALEAASQAVWMSGGGSARECARRHLSLIRWDYEELRKSTGEAAGKKRIRDLDLDLIERLTGTFVEDELKQPTHFSVLEATASAIGMVPDRLTHLWRAASGAAHGKAWPAMSLQHVIPLEEYEPGQFRTLRIADTDGMTEVLQTASSMTTYGALRHADFCGADIAALLEDARLWLVSVTPFREDADPDVMDRLRRPQPPAQS